MRCIRIVKSADNSVNNDNTLILPDAQCGAGKPRDSEPCELMDCPPMWNVGQWEPCSVSCGSGEQRRNIICEQIKADGKLQQYAVPTPCAEVPKPPSFQLCNLGK